MTLPLLLSLLIGVSSTLVVYSVLIYSKCLAKPSQLGWVMFLFSIYMAGMASMYVGFFIRMAWIVYFAE